MNQPSIRKWSLQTVTVEEPNNNCLLNPLNKSQVESSLDGTSRRWMKPPNKFAAAINPASVKLPAGDICPSQQCRLIITTPDGTRMQVKAWIAAISTMSREWEISEVLKLMHPSTPTCKQRTLSARVHSIQNKTLHSCPRAKQGTSNCKSEHGILLSLYLFCKSKKR